MMISVSALSYTVVCSPPILLYLALVDMKYCKIIYFNNKNLKLN